MYPHTGEMIKWENVIFSFSHFEYNQESILPNVFSGKLSQNYRKSILIPERMVTSKKGWLLYGKRLFSIKYNNLNRMSTVCKSLNESITVAGLNTILYEGSYRI